MIDQIIIFIVGAVIVVVVGYYLILTLSIIVGFIALVLWKIIDKFLE